jgi:nucleoside-diphosphate-sugar epimerase
MNNFMHAMQNGAFFNKFLERFTRRHTQCRIPRRTSNAAERGCGYYAKGANMRVLITGGAGYLGSVLARLLINQGDQVRVIDKLMYGGAPIIPLMAEPGFEFVRGDIVSERAVASAVAGMDAIVHLAAIVGDPACARDLELARRTNIEGALNVYEQAKATAVGRFIFASTCSNYGRMNTADDFLTEDAPLRPVSFYAESKVEVEKHILKDGNSCLHPLVLRFATLYGLSPRMRFDLTVNEFTADLAKNNTLRVYGEQFWRPYVHVRDAATAVIASLAAAPGAIAQNVFNVGDSQQNFRKQDLIEMIREFIPNSKVDYVSRQEDPRDYRVKVKNTVRDGISEIIRAVKSEVYGDIKSDFYRNC